MQNQENNYISDYDLYRILSFHQVNERRLGKISRLRQHTD